MFEKREEKGRKLEKKKGRTVWRRRWRNEFCSWVFEAWKRRVGW